jgi:hypothetical protein
VKIELVIQKGLTLYTINRAAMYPRARLPDAFDAVVSSCLYPKPFTALKHSFASVPDAGVAQRLTSALMSSPLTPAFVLLPS